MKTGNVRESKHWQSDDPVANRLRMNDWLMQFFPRSESQGTGRPYAAAYQGPPSTEEDTVANNPPDWLINAFKNDPKYTKNIYPVGKADMVERLLGLLTRKK